jgi:hypothetical protein
VSDDPGERFVLALRPPVRALAITAVTALLGALLVVLAQMLELGPVLVIIGAALLFFAVSLGVISALLVARLRSTVVLDSDAINVIRGRRTSRLAWSAVDHVMLKGPRLTLVTKPDQGESVTVVNPRTPSDRTFMSLVAAVQGRLNADRGYRTG